ncbi:hypothetical protein Hamer_G028754 [Homarus americanus]|uniref:Uncharacterized protein n=1 Tax=Homarus americanus TaxID=6706 RepID=A0A8J5JUV4_HOMAM|nr:hypothetical protein Hamer_G028754 [Homarus americanus]
MPRVLCEWGSSCGCPCGSQVWVPERCSCVPEVLPKTQ